MRAARLRDRARRRRGQAPRPAHARPGQARRAVRRQLPPDRLRALEPRQRRLPADRRAHAVQEPLARPPHRDRPGALSPLLGNYVTPVPAQMRRGPRWFAGSADAIYQNFNLLNDERPDYVIVFGADHIYRMDPRQMVEQHIESGAGVTVAALRAPIDQADQFGVIETAAGRAHDRRVPGEADGRRRGCPTRPTRSTRRWATTSSRADVLRRGASPRTRRTRRPSHDMGGNIIPMLVERGDAQVYDFSQNEVPGATRRATRGYWRDVGTLDAFYEAHMDLISVDPVFNLYNREWPILTWLEPLPPAKFVFADEGRDGPRARLDGLRGRRRLRRRGAALGALARACTCTRYASVEDSVLFPGVEVGRGAVVRSAIVDKNVRIAPGRAGRRRPRARPRALHGLRRRHRRDRQGRRRRGRDARRAAHPRVPARGLRRRRRPRRVPRARAARASRT